MKRFIDNELEQWKGSRRRKPLILRGARQVGKTYAVKEFGKSAFDNIALVDMERNPNWHRVFEANLSARRICADLEILLKQKIVPGKTLLFIDEIQECPRAITALRYFYEEMPDLHVVAAGSLLEFAMKDISFPVGRIQFLHLYPLCFAEYLLAIGNDEAAGIVLGAPGPTSQAIHDYLCDELRRYFFVGGMPVDRQCLNSVFTSIAQGVGKQIKYSHLGEGYSNPTLKKAFEVLCLAQVSRKVQAVNPAGLPLGASASAKTFKALMVDIGLMQNICGMSVDVEYAQTNLLDIYRGAMAEQFIGQEMAVSQKGDVYYWSRQARSSSAEIDYVALVNGLICPVEVKSGASGTLKSLHLFLETYTHSGNGIVFSMRPYALLPEKRITFVPLYFAFSATRGSIPSE